MKNNDDLLIDVRLIPNPDADEEMSGNDIEKLSDEEIRGSRFLLVKRAVEIIDINGQNGGAIQLSCEFQPAENTRFTWGSISLTLISPNGAKFISVQPEVIKDGNPVNFQIKGNGKITLGYADIAGAEVSREKQKQFVVYENLVQGTGEGTAKAVWIFKENTGKSGLTPRNILSFTIPTTGIVKAELSVNCRVVRSGIAGVVDKLRDLIIEPVGLEKHQVTFQIPTEKHKESWSLFDFIK
jgi:hypothetical protein